MFFDWINCLIEFTILFLFFHLLAQPQMRLRNIVIYSLLCILMSTISVMVSLPLIVNILIFMLFPLLAFLPRFKNEYFLFTAISMLLIIYLQFMCYSLLPLFLLQTNLGNFIGNVTILIFSIAVSFFFRKYKVSSLITSFVLRHKFSILFILMFTSLLGQSYLSRLSNFWTYLPGLVSILIFGVFSILFSMYIHYARSADRLHAQMLTKNMDNIELYVTSLRIQNHDYKHHISNIKNQVYTATDLTLLKEQLSQYINLMEHDHSLENIILSLKHPVIRASIYGCYVKCLQNSIEFHLSSTDQLPNFPLKDYQFVEIFENMTSNAIEHNITLPPFERKLIISLSAFNGRNEITISNPTQNINLEISEMFQIGSTSKDSSHSGLGLSIIQKIISQTKIQFFGTTTDSLLSFTLLYEEN